MSRIVSIVLAAGWSSRTAPLNKLLQPLGARSVLGTTLARLDESEVDEILVVVRRGGPPVDREAVAACPRCTVIGVRPTSEGLSATLAAGLARLAADASGVLISLGDMPLVRTETINALLHCFRTSKRRRPIVAPGRDGRRGNPVLWDRAYVEALAGLTGDEGGRLLLKANDTALELVDTDDDGIFLDIDNPAALDASRARLLRE